MISAAPQVFADEAVFRLIATMLDMVGFLDWLVTASGWGGAAGVFLVVVGVSAVVWHRRASERERVFTPEPIDEFGEDMLRVADAFGVVR